MKDFNEQMCWEAGEGYNPMDCFNPSDREINDIQSEYNDILHEFLYDMALRFFEPEVADNFTDRDWEDFREELQL